MAGQTNEQTRRSNPQLTDWLAAVVGTSPNSPQNGGTDALIQIQNLLSLIISDMTNNQVNALLKREVSIRVAATGGVATQLTGKVGISGVRTDTGVYELTAASGTWYAAVVTTNSGTGQPASFMVSGWGTPTITVRAFNTAGDPSNENLVVMGTLT